MTRHASTTTSVFAGNLRTAQALANTTTEALARQLNVGLRTVQRWRSGTTEPGGEALVALAVALEQEPGWFYTDHSAESVAA